MLIGQSMIGRNKMKRKILMMIISLIGLSSLVVFGRSPELIENVLRSIKGSSSGSILLPEDKIASQEAILNDSENIQERKTLNANLKSTATNSDVPDEIVYFILFNHLVSLKGEAAKETDRGRPLDYFKLYQDQAKLTNSQSQLLFQTAQDCIDATSQIDREARDIIVKAREDFTRGEAGSPSDIPPPPRELKALQEQKNTLVLQFRDVLRDQLGTETFAEFDTFARQKITPQVTSIRARQEDK